MILHIATTEEWERACHNGGPYEPAGFAIDGFIHCSSATQVSSTLRTWFPGRADLVLLHLDEGVVGPDLKLEPGSLGEAELFPHLYRPIDVDAVIDATPLPLDPEGVHVLPDWWPSSSSSSTEPPPQPEPEPEPEPRSGWVA